MQVPDIATSRESIDRIDSQIVRLFEERMRVSRDIALYKQAHHMDILNPAREQQVLKARVEQLEDHTFDNGIVELFETLMSLSRPENRLYGGSRRLQRKRCRRLFR